MQMIPLLQLVLVLIGAFCFILSFIHIMRGRPGATAFFFVGIISCASAAFFIPLLLSFLAVDGEEPAPEPQPEPTTPEPVRAPAAEPATPVDLTWVLWICGIVVACALAWFLAARVRQRRMVTSEMVRAWCHVRDTYDAALLTIASYETDIDKAITCPAFNDPSVPTSKAMIDSLRTATATMEMTRTKAKIGGSPALLHQAQEDVRQLIAAVEHAEQYARAKGMFWRTPGETALLKQMQMLLTQARDHANAPMRETLYRRLTKKAQELHRMVGAHVVPDTSVQRELEQRGYPQLTA